LVGNLEYEVAYGTFKKEFAIICLMWLFLFPGEDAIE
jgi:hypothetical protein